MPEPSAPLLAPDDLAPGLASEDEDATAGARRGLFGR